MNRPLMPVRGRGGRLIVVDERKGAPLAKAINTLPHPREALQTQPMDLLPERELTSWSDRFLDWVSHWGLVILATVGLASILAVLVAGVLRG